MKLLVFGRAGQVAQSLADLSGKDLEIICRGREAGDIRDTEWVARCLAGEAPDVVVNAAAYTAVDQAETEEEVAYAINRDGAHNIAKACASANRPLIHFSTDYVYPGDKQSPYVETDPTGPMSVYGASKLAGEGMVRAVCPDHIILRTAWVYSPYGQNFVKTMLRLAETRDRLNVVDDQVGSPSYAPHIAAAVVQMARSVSAGAPHYGTYHLAGGGETSWYGFAKAIFQCSAAHDGGSCDVDPIPSSAYPTPAVRPANSRLDCSAIQRDFDVQLPSWRSGLETCMGHMLSA